MARGDVVEARRAGAEEDEGHESDERGAEVREHVKPVTAWFGDHPHRGGAPALRTPRWGARPE